MSEVIAAILGLLLLATLKRLWDQRRAARALHQAIVRRRLLLTSEVPSFAGSDWNTLSAAVNEMVEELGRVQKLRSGQLAQLEATLGSLQEGVLIVDESNAIILANKGLQDMFPQITDLLGQRLERVLHSAKFLEYVGRVRQALEPQRVQEVEFVGDKKTIWVEVTGTAIPSLSGHGAFWALFVLHDITNLKRLETVRKEFVANVSHELRTPLSVIKGYVETLVDAHGQMPVEDRDRFLRTIQRHTERLNSLLEDLLTLSRLESINPGLRRETTDLARLVEGVLADFRGQPISARYQLVSEVDPGVGSLLIDPLKVTQALENLVQNALKYSPPGSSIRVGVRAMADGVQVNVSDDGPGIPEADLPHIFERFYRVDKGRSREKGGTGLGLSIVKHIVQLHQGRVWVDSRLGRGSTFYFSLPQRSMLGIASEDDV